MIIRILYITVCLVIINTGVLAQTKFYVSPKGNDAGRGTPIINKIDGAWENEITINGLHDLLTGLMKLSGSINKSK